MDVRQIARNMGLSSESASESASDLKVVKKIKALKNYTVGAFIFFFVGILTIFLALQPNPEFGETGTDH